MKKTMTMSTKNNLFKVLICILSHRNATDEEKRRSQKGFVEEKVELYEELAELNK